MSGQLHDVGSVVEFYPGSFQVESWQGNGTDDPGKSEIHTDKAVGWAVVVTHRESWVIETELQPMVVCCGAVRPLGLHFSADHPTEAVWSYRVSF